MNVASAVNFSPEVFNEKANVYVRAMAFVSPIQIFHGGKRHRVKSHHQQE